MEIKQDASGLLLVNRGNDWSQCLGDLMYFSGHGVYEPTFGLVDVTPEQAEAHNHALDAMRLAGMDKNCEIGQGSFAYLMHGQVQTFCGTVIAEHCQISGNVRKTIYFKRAGKQYRGVLQKDADVFNFKRVK